jgi:hypothetical protein
MARKCRPAGLIIEKRETNLSMPRRGCGAGQQLTKIRSAARIQVLAATQLQLVATVFLS